MDIEQTTQCPSCGAMRAGVICSYCGQYKIKHDISLEEETLLVTKSGTFVASGSWIDCTVPLVNNQKTIHRATINKIKNFLKWREK